MDWIRVGKYGMKCGPYSVGKVFLDGCTLYQVWFNNDNIKTCNDFAECNQVVAEHAKSQSKEK